MARESSAENDEFEEVALEYLLTFSKKYLTQGLLKCVTFEQEHIFKIKALREENKVLKKKNEHWKNLVKIYTPKSMTLRMRKLFYKINVMTLTKSLKVKRIWIHY